MTKPLSNRKRSALRGQLIAYLAETMPEAQREEFERRLLDEDVFSEQVHQAEQELLEDYADGALSAVHRKQLASWIFCSSGRRKHVQLTADLLYLSRRSRMVAFRLYVGLFAACVLLFVGLRLLHPLRYLKSVAQDSATHSSLPMPNFNAPSEPAGLDGADEIAGSDAAATLKPMVIRLVPERVHGAEEPSASSTYTIEAAAPVLLQTRVPSGGCEYGVTLHAETGGIADKHVERASCVSVGEAQYVDMDLPPGGLSPGQYTVRVTGSEEVWMARFLVHF
jgi:hypothetical protein